jgi:16S rRNA (guanine966-N2)-methyltransferase
MRIIGGEFRSRKLLTPRDAGTTRPLPDRVRESLFGLLRGHCEGAAVFDAFAGTGSFGLEVLSRGAERCTFVERDRDAADLLRRNIDLLGVQDRAELVVGDALGPGALARCPRPATLIWLDPPYALARDPVGWKRLRAQMERLVPLLSEDGFLMFRSPWPFSLHVRRDRPEEPAAPFESRRVRSRRPRREPGRERSDTVFDIERDSHRRDRAEGAGVAASEPPLLDAEDQPEPQQPAPDVQYIKPDLSLPGAEGPETHIYHSTAIHLYARPRPAPRS